MMDNWQPSRKRVLLYGMSGTGKTHISKILAKHDDWDHHSLDYIIGKDYLKLPNVSIDNLDSITEFIGNPGDAKLGGIEFDAYMKKQEEFKKAEMEALSSLSEYVSDNANFVCDTGGSICEWIDTDNESDSLLKKLSDNFFMIWIKHDENHVNELMERFNRNPKPMCYRIEFINEIEKQVNTEGDPQKFAKAAFANAMQCRSDRYEFMAKKCNGVTVSMDEIFNCSGVDEFLDLIDGKIHES